MAVFLLPNIAYGQIWNLGLSGESIFSRELDAMHWNMNGLLVRQIKNLNISFRNQFNSRLYLLNGKAQNIQDENEAGLNIIDWVNPKIGFTGKAQSYMFTTNNVSHYTAMVGPTYRIDNQIIIEPLAGLMSDRRSGHLDQGPLLGLQTRFKSLTLGEVSLKPQLNLQYANIKPRKSHTYSLGTKAYYDQNNVSMNANFHIGETRRDSYQPSSFLNRDINNVVESIVSDSTELNLNLNFPIVHNLTGKSTFYVLTDVRRFINNYLVPQTSNDLLDSRFVRQEMNWKFTSDYHIPFGQLSGGFNYTLINTDSRLINTDSISTARIERRQQILQNSAFTQHQFSLFTDNTIQIGQRNNLETRGRISILHYDTPPSNFDDRDELSYQINISDEENFTNYLTGKITMAGEAYHNVFLYAQRSIENHWRRSIRLIPEIDWQPIPRISIQQHFMIRANYTVYDFHLPGKPINNQSSREYGYSTNANIQINPNWSVSLQGSRHELRIGQLYWKQFQEVPLDTLITYESQARLTHNFHGMTVSAGVRFFLKYDHLQAAKIQISVPENGSSQIISRVSSGKQTTLQWGPTVEIKMDVSPKNELFIKGWLQKQNIRKKLYTVFPKPYLAQFRNKEKTWDTRIFPNLTIHARFYF